MAIFVLGLPDDTMAAFKLALKVLGFIDIFSLTDALEPSAVYSRELLIRCVWAHQTVNSVGFPTEQLTEFYDKYQVITDLPCAALASRLIDMYPDNKVLLLPRSLQSHSDINDTLSSRLLARLAWLDLAGFRSNWGFLHSMWDVVHGGNLPSLYMLLRVMLSEKGRTEATGDLLEFDPLQGTWAVLCKFLGMEVPVGLDPAEPVVTETARGPHLNVPDAVAKRVNLNRGVVSPLKVTRSSLVRAYTRDFFGVVPDMLVILGAMTALGVAWFYTLLSVAKAGGWMCDC